jgi:Thaumarchaeal output domain 1
MADVSFYPEKSLIEYGDKKYLVVTPTKELRIERSLDYVGIIIDAKGIEFTRMIVKRIRGHFNPEIYLKPILLLNGNAHRDAFIRHLIDGMIYSPEQLSLVHSNVENILLRIKDLTFTNSVSLEAQIISKLMCWQYSRENELIEPIPYTLSNINYSYPFLACSFEFQEEAQVLEILDICQKESLISGDFHDRIYLCSTCQSGALSYRETCTKCGSSNNNSFDVVHHFPCAYVGPITDFTNELDDQLDCPKCSKRLKHIGVDYDKPSVLHLCNTCGHRFQDFSVFAKCMSCTFDNNVEQLIQKQINTYRVTKKGQITAINGYVTTPKDIDEIIGTVKIETFKTMVKYEIERLRQTEGSSNIVAINIKNAGQVYAKVGSKAQQSLLKDMVAEIRSSIRSSDMISFFSSSIILINMNEIPTKICNRIVDEILQLLRNLIGTNFRDLTIQLEGRVQQLNYNLSGELQIQQVISNF